jgi:hypothetical protein
MHEAAAAVETRDITAHLDEAWFQRLAQAVDSDIELNLIGRYFTATLSLTFGDKRHDLIFSQGKLAQVRHGKKIDWRADFGFRASEKTWNLFFADPPPPLYNSVFAMIMRVPDFHLEGDSLSLAQNVRAVTRFMEILQKEARR